ncbi:uncharacterized protein LDX57_005037 [Aspergillus melleus]|uniref:uncharacterized protein n=1 Tax=Aspergillus melleus TaxID=138277 RepID=UPI001E8D18C0|nr:uncharacterized protein LDX57_005037 [Aspergillus melleus]KAH8427323.1 hypothetical protein LDX57_005037 [Aspergillus melleus]
MTIDTTLQEHGLVAETPPLAHLYDEAIIDKLQNPAPLTSERNLWAFWDGGFHAMPGWKQRNVLNWVRRCGHDWDVRLLDNVAGSSANIKHFVPRESLPDAVWDGQMEGEHAGQHTSELVRLALLYHHGGVFLDVSILMLRDPDALCWASLADERSPHRVSAWYHINMGQVVHSSLAARRHDPFIYRWMQVFLQMWSRRRHADGLHSHPLVRHLELFQIKVFNIPADKNWVGYNDYTAILLAFQRVARNCEPDGGFDGPAYVQQHFHLLSVSDEMETGFFVPAEKLPLLLTLPVQGQGEGGDGADAKRYVYKTLAQSSVANYHQGIKYLGYANPVATQWNSAGDDCRPGSWGERLRYGSVHYRQTRKVEPAHMKEMEPTYMGMLDTVE